MDTVELVKKLFKETEQTVPNIYDKVISSATEQGLLATGSAAASATAGAAASIVKTKGFIISVASLAATAVVSLSVGIPLALSGDDAPPSGSGSGTGQEGGTGGSDGSGEDIGGGAAHTHIYGDWTVEFPATCTVDGERSRSCSCGDKQTEKISAAHSFTEYSVDSETHSRECTVCHEKQSGKHDFMNDKHTCAACGEVLKVTEGLDYVAIKNGAEYKVNGLGTSTAKDIVIAPLYNGKPVTAIGENAFKDANITSVYIPSGVTYIYDYAFGGCEKLASIYLPASIKFLSHRAYSGCCGVNKIEVEEGNAGYYSSGNCLIDKRNKSLLLGCDDSVIPDDGSIISIGDKAFYKRKNLKTITLPDSITLICDGAFQESGLTEINLPDKLETILGSAFASCSGLTEIEIPQSVEHIYGWAFRWCSNLRTIKLPDTVKIGEFVFHETGYYNNANNWTNFYNNGRSLYLGPHLLSVENFSGNFPMLFGTKTIAGGAFYNTGLTSIVIDGLDYIDTLAFRGASNLTSIVGGSDVYECAGNCIIERQSRTLVIGCKSSIIPDDGSVLEIGNDAFCGVEFGGGTLQIPQSVEIIGSHAFGECKGLTTVIIPSSVRFVYAYAFYGSDVKEVIIQGTEDFMFDRQIHLDAFANCDKLESVTLTKDFSNIGKVFGGCNSLKEINFKGTYAEWVRKLGEWKDFAEQLKLMSGDILIKCTDCTVTNSGNIIS